MEGPRNIAGNKQMSMIYCLIQEHTEKKKHLKTPYTNGVTLKQYRSQSISPKVNSEWLER